METNTSDLIEDLYRAMNWDGLSPNQSETVATLFVYFDQRNSAYRLIHNEALVKSVLGSQWQCLAVTSVGFVSLEALKSLRFPKGSELRRVVDHLCSDFYDIALSSCGTFVITPAGAQNYVERARHKYRNWIK